MATLEICRKIEDEIDAIDSQIRKSKYLSSARRKLRLKRALFDYYQERINGSESVEVEGFVLTIQDIEHKVHSKVKEIIAENE